MITALATRTLAVVVAAAALGWTLTGCVPEPTGTPSGGPGTAAPGTSESATPSPSATTTDPTDAITLPDGCEQLYSGDMLTQLRENGRPLNDPGITLYATRIVPALEIIESGAPTLRCTWGAPGEGGLATNVTIVDPDQAATVMTSLVDSGYGCEDLDGGTVCRIESQTVDLDDNLVTQGETHYLRGNGWVATAWITFSPEGYTEDIVTTLWG